MYCPNCGKELSDQAKSCPHCGHPLAQARPGAAVSPKSRLAALLFCVFLGGIGIHRFYVGKAGTGILWLFTAGLAGVGWIIDLIMIGIGSFYDKGGNRLV